MRHNDIRSARMHLAKFLPAMAFSAAVLLPVVAAAQDDFGVVEQRIRALAPAASSIAISETPIDGLLMVQVGGDIIYVTADGKYMVQGRVMDLDTMEDLTEGAKSEIRREKLAEVDPASQITFAPENPKYDLMVFTDIDCGYCRKLHSQIDAYNEQGIAIHYMAFPRAGIGSHSYEKAVSVWCADDPRTALTEAKLGSEPDPAQCDNPVEEDYNLGVALGVSGTPSLVTPDGQMIPGYVPPDQLRSRLDQMAAASAPE
jgi:thiol:disulfide interchange protein DsbC